METKCPVTFFYFVGISLSAVAVRTYDESDTPPKSGNLAFRDKLYIITVEGERKQLS